MHRITSENGLSLDPAVSRDGTLLAYASDAGGRGNLDIWVQQLNGTSPVRLTNSDIDAHEPTFSPSGTQIAFRSERDGGGIYVIPTLGGTARLVAAQGQNPPDGKWIAYWIGPITSTVGVPGAGTVQVVPVAGGPAHQVGRYLTEAGNPVWSPDGNRLIVLGTRTQSTGETEFDWWIVPDQGVDAKPTGLLKTTRQHGFSYVPRVCEWTKEGILFNAVRGDSGNLWRLGLDRRTGRVTGSPQRLTSGGTYDFSGNITPDGSLIWVTVAKSYNVWSIALKANQGIVVGDIKRLTDRSTREVNASLSADGRYLVYASTRTGDRDVWLKDLLTGGETPLAAAKERWEEHPEISRDGELVAYSSDLPPELATETSGQTFVVHRSGGIPEKVCEGCGAVWDWSLDDKNLLVETDEGQLSAVASLSLEKHQKASFLRSAKNNVYEAKFSPDGKWVAFAAGTGGHSRIFIAAVRDGKAAPEAEWISASDLFGSSNKPRWSPDGNLIYFVSRRDGFLCLWAQRLTPRTRQLAGAPFSIAHFHQTHRSMMNVADGVLEIAVAKDKIVFNLSELTGHIWSAEIK